MSEGPTSTCTSAGGGARTPGKETSKTKLACALGASDAGSSRAACCSSASSAKKRRDRSADTRSAADARLSVSEAAPICGARRARQRRRAGARRPRKSAHLRVLGLRAYGKVGDERLHLGTAAAEKRASGRRVSAEAAGARHRPIAQRPHLGRCTSTMDTCSLVSRCAMMSSIGCKERRR